MLICFFKQKTAYEMRISDWSSDVCSSDLQETALGTVDPAHLRRAEAGVVETHMNLLMQAQRQGASPAQPRMRHILDRQVRFLDDRIEQRRLEDGLPRMPDRKSTRLNSSH